jgi:hypothetical protein
LHTAVHLRYRIEDRLIGSKRTSRPNKKSFTMMCASLNFTSTSPGYDDVHSLDQLYFKQQTFKKKEWFKFIVVEEVGGTKNMPELLLARCWERPAAKQQ